MYLQQNAPEAQSLAESRCFTRAEAIAAGGTRNPAEAIPGELCTCSSHSPSHPKAVQFQSPSRPRSSHHSHRLFSLIYSRVGIAITRQHSFNTSTDSPQPPPRLPLSPPPPHTHHHTPRRCNGVYRKGVRAPAKEVEPLQDHHRRR